LLYSCFLLICYFSHGCREYRIRKQYKRKALELHPDRNFNDVENATRKFAEVQTAYEILSDPQERAWYDSHREAILNGDDDLAGGPNDQSSSNHTSASAIFNLMSRFNSSVPMTDSPTGFFGILDAFFDQLAAEERSAAEWDGLTPMEYPPFGLADDDYETVAKPFYRIWSGFSTKKSFSWKDKYRLSDAPDRRIRRLMEKENKKLREEGIREFNDAVISLVSFVRKRDPRYVPNKQSEAERQQILRNSAATQAARSRAANQEKLADFVVPEWAQSRDDELAQHEGEFSMSEEESEFEEIECVVCDKTFKSEKQFEAHEKSKKHVKAVQQLQRQMKKENAALNLTGKGKSANKTQAPTVVQEDELGDEISGDELEDIVNNAPEVLSDGQQESGNEKDQHPEAVDHAEADKPATTPSPYSSEDDEYAPRSAVEERILSGHSKTSDQGLEDDEDASPTAMSSLAASVSNLELDESGAGNKKVGKAKLKREKKAAKQAAATDANAQASVSIPLPMLLGLYAALWLLIDVLFLQ